MLTTLLEKEAVPFATLHERYGTLLELVRKLIGVVPNCDPYLEIWPNAFRTYNVMVPNLLNLPFLLWGRGPSQAMGLAMYVASRAAGCPYCSAHTCAFALRRGATAEEVAASMTGAALSAGQRAAVEVARALASVPARPVADLSAHFSPADAEWIVLSIAMMGWLNKAMDALGIPLEVPTVEEVNAVIAPSGWTPGQHMRELPPDGKPPRADSLATKLGVVPLIPNALSLDRKWLAGVPDRWPQVGDFLREATGHDFPLLGRLRHRRAIRAIAAMIRDNLDSAPSVVGREAKLSAGLVYAEVVGDAALAHQLCAVGAAPPDDTPLIRLARAISPSPARVDEAALDDARAIPPAGIVELVSFVSVLQLLHRLGLYYPG